MSALRFEATDDDTASLLDLLADDGTVSADHEWHLFLDALATAADADGVIRPNRLRPLVRGRVKPSRIGAFMHRAVCADVIRPTGEWQVSDDTTSRNSGKPSRCYVLVGTR